MNEFPKISEKFILYQIKDLIDLGHEVHIYALFRSKEKKVHPEVIQYNLLSKTTFLLEGFPSRRNKRVLKAMMVILRYVFFYPREIFRCLNDKSVHALFDKIKNLYILETFINKNYEVIHCHFGTVASQLIFLKKIFPSIRFITTFHQYDLRIGLEKGGEIYRELFRLADYIISICSYNREHLKTLGCPERKLFDHHNGIDLQEFSPSPDRNDNGTHIITTVARLVEQKNIPFALDVIKALKDQNKYKFKYCLIGNGHLKNEIDKKIHELDIADCVVHLGELSSDDVIKKLQETDVFFLPSRFEAFPTVLLEAQAVGVPVVATDVGGTRETFINEKSGYLIAHNDLREAVSRIAYLLDNESIRDQFGKMGRLFVEENFDISKLNRRLAQLYQSSLDGVVQYQGEAK